MSKQCIYRVIFLNQGKVYEIYAREVSQDGMFGFIMVGDLVFGESSAVVVDPSEERLKREFEGVQRFHLPLHAVMRIDELDKSGSGKITSLPGDDGKVTPFPGAFYPPPPKGE